MPESNGLKTDFEDVPETPSSEPPAKDENGVPYCRVHHCRMKHASSGRKGSQVAYYSCPVDGCDEKEKRIKTTVESSIPNEPMQCGNCSKNSKKPVYMERDDRLSNGYYTILACPCCGRKSQPMPRPEFVAINQKQRQRVREPEVGSR